MGLPFTSGLAAPRHDLSRGWKRGLLLSSFLCQSDPVIATKSGASPVECGFHRVVV